MGRGRRGTPSSAPSMRGAPSSRSVPRRCLRHRPAARTFVSPSTPAARSRCGGPRARGRRTSRAPRGGSARGWRSAARTEGQRRGHAPSSPRAPVTTSPTSNGCGELERLHARAHRNRSSSAGGGRGGVAVAGGGHRREGDVMVTDDVRLATTDRRWPRPTELPAAPADPAAPRPSAAYGVHSEVGRLRKVLVCAPGVAHRRLTPTTSTDLLFDDVLWVENAQQDHLDFVETMRARGVDVVELHDVLAQTMAVPGARDWLLERVVTPDVVGLGLVEPLRGWLDQLGPWDLAVHLIGGLAVEDLPEELRGGPAALARTAPDSREYL